MRQSEKRLCIKRQVHNPNARQKTPRRGQEPDWIRMRLDGLPRRADQSRLSLNAWLGACGVLVITNWLPKLAGISVTAVQESESRLVLVCRL